MFRTWLLRGCAVAVFAVLLGAWAAGVIGHSDPPSPAAQVSEPEPPAHTPAMTRVQPGGVLEKARHRHHRKAHPSDDPTPESTPSASDDPTTEAPDPSPSDTPHSTHSPDPSDPPSHPSPPTHDPSPTPTDPEEECSGLGGILGCVLDPITGQP